MGIAALGGCGGGALSEDASTTGTAGTTGNGGGLACGGIGGTGGTGTTETLPATCPATCGTAAGDVYQFVTVEGVASALAGPWEICEDSGTAFLGRPADAIGVAFGPPECSSMDTFGPMLTGNMYYLVQSPNGPVPGTGVDYQLTYDLFESAPTLFQLNLRTTSRLMLYLFKYSPCPRQFEFDPAAASTAIIAPFASDGGTPPVSF